MKASSFARDPREQFLKWVTEAQLRVPKARAAGVPINFQWDAMVLATATRAAAPSARVVLYKGLNELGPVFFTNYSGRKARELRVNPKAAIVFYWPYLGRQLRVEGRVERISPADSDAYWVTRPRESQLGAHASPQSSVIPSKQFLLDKIGYLSKRFRGKEIPRPKNWGGYVLVPSQFEFWQLGDYRIHLRHCYRRSGTKWRLVQLAP